MFVFWVPVIMPLEVVMGAIFGLAENFSLVSVWKKLLKF